MFQDILDSLESFSLKDLYHFKDRLDLLIKKTKPDIIFHLASKAGSMEYYKKNAFEVFSHKF